MALTITCTCPKWRKLSDDQKADRVWQLAHQLHHNLKRHRPPFTVRRLAELAECSEAAALAVLDEATRLKWFRHIPPAAGQPGYYLDPAKPKG